MGERSINQTHGLSWAIKRLKDLPTELYYISGDRALDDLVSAKTWRISEPVTSLVPHFYVLSWGYSLTAARLTAGDMKQPPWF